MICPQCRTRNSDEARVCVNCATPLEAPRRVDAERKFVTVLFADVVNSTAIAEQLDPEEHLELMNGAFDFMSAAVSKYGGMVARLLGDAILAIFGAPATHEDDPERAVHAGLEIRDAAREYARRVQRRYGLNFQVRVGIHSGLAVLGMVGNQLRAEYTAMGDTTNVASRMQTAAEPGTVLISADTYRLVKMLFDFRPRGALELKGKSTPVESYEVVGPKAAPGRRRSLDVSSRFVGRDQELALLSERLDRLLKQEGAFVAVVGEAGLGKSRLVAEVRSLVLDGAVAWFEGRTISYGQSISYYPWQQILEQSVRAVTNQQETPASLEDTLQHFCAAYDFPDEHVPFLQALLGAESERTLQLLAGLHGDVRLERITEAMRAYFQVLAHVQPLVIVFEDLHWADESSLELLLNIADLTLTAPLLLIGVLRPDHDAPSWPVLERWRTQLSAHFSEIALEPLPAHQSQALLSNLLPADNLPESVRDLLLNKSEGNPLYLEAVIQALLDAGHLVHDNGHWQVTSEITQMTIPDTLTGVLSARIDRLPEETKHVAQMAAVLGRAFAASVLEAIYARVPVEERIDPLAPHLERLLEAQLLRLPANGSEYIFKHALIQEAAYNSLLLSRRREFHHHAGLTLEALYPERLDELAPQLANHFRLSQDWARAGDYALRAGRRAMQVYALRQALEHYAHAVSAYEALPELPEEKWMDATLEWSAVTYRLRGYAEALEPLAQVEAMARRRNDKRRLALALHWIATIHIAKGTPSKGFSAMAENERLAEELEDELLGAVPRYFAAMTLIDRDPRSALEQLEHVVELAQAIQDRGIEADTLGVKAMAHARLGEFAEARQMLQRALEIAKRADALIRLADADITTSLVYYDMGDVERGLEHSQRATEILLPSGAVECQIVGLYCMGLGNLRKQNWAKALTAFEEAVRLTPQSGLDTFHNPVHAGLALARFFSGETEALSDVEAARENTRVLGDLYTTAFLSYSLGQAYMQLGELEQAQREFDEALDYYRRQGMRPYVARTLQDLSKLYTRQGHHREANQAWTEAEQLLAELEADTEPMPETEGLPEMVK